MSKIFHYAQEIVLPHDPIDFAWRLRSWGMDTSHKGLNLVLSDEVLKYMEDWSYSYYYDHFRLIVGLYQLALIGTRVQIGNTQVVVVDQLLLQTSQVHKPVFHRDESVIVSPVKICLATMDD